MTKKEIQQLKETGILETKEGIYEIKPARKGEVTNGFGRGVPYKPRFKVRVKFTPSLEFKELINK